MRCAWLRGLGGVGWGAVLSGCVQIYQPMSGLHRPVVVDPQAANLVGMRLVVHCIPGDLLTSAEASVLCQKVGALFENQGAQVQTVAAERLLPEDLLNAGGDVPEAQVASPVTEADLVLELRARLIHESDDPLLWALCIGTSTLVPAVTELTFAQDVVIRDASGFLLVSDSLQGRLVRRFGVGVWVGNRVLNLLVREDADKLTEETASQDLSADLYGQLSQLVFNARMQWEVLQEAAISPEAGAWR